MGREYTGPRPRTEGRQAYYDGLPRTMSPYKDRYKHHRWLDGWDQAKERAAEQTIEDEAESQRYADELEAQEDADRPWNIAKAAIHVEFTDAQEESLVNMIDAIREAIEGPKY